MSHLHQFDYQIKPTERSKLKGHQAFLIWFTGLSGSGKSTVASHIDKILFDQGIHTFILDGDALRNGLNKDLDFSDKGRTENIRRIAEVSKLFLDAGIVVIAAFVSPFRKDRELVREIIGDHRMVEVYVNTPLEECEKRDVKGLYARARKGEIRDFTGISSPYEVPESPDLVIDTSKTTPEGSAMEVFDYLTKSGLIR